MDLKIDKEFQSLIPPLSKEEYEQLEKNIVADGCREALVAWNGVIVDGHNRYKICKQHDIVFKVQNKQFLNRSEVIVWMLENQLGRRNLTDFCRNEIALKYQKMIAEQMRKRMSIGGGDKKSEKANIGYDHMIHPDIEPTTQRKEMAKIAGTSEGSIYRSKLILKKGTQEQINRARQGGKGNSITTISNEIKKEELPKKICKTCKKELPITEFYKEKSDCKTCYNQNNNITRDFKGNAYKISKELRNIREEDIIGDLYNEDREVEYTIEDVAEDFTVNFETYFDSLKGIFEDNKELIKENKEKMEQVLSKAVDSIMQLKGEYLI